MGKDIRITSIEGQSSITISGLNRTEIQQIVNFVFSDRKCSCGRTLPQDWPKELCYNCYTLTGPTVEHKDKDWWVNCHPHSKW